MDNKLKPQKVWVKEGFIGQRMIVLPPNIKRKIITNQVIKNFYLTAIGHYPNAANHGRERKTGSNQYILIYCVEGGGTINSGGVTHTLIPNSYYIIPKNLPHSYNSDANNAWSIYWIHFTGDISDKIFDRYLHNGAPVVQHIPYDENRIKNFEQIYSILENSFNEKEMEVMNIYLLHFISSLIYYKEANPAIYNTDSISNSILFMKKKIGKNLTIEELAKQQNLSVSHYSRVFKQKTGASPITFFNQLKIQKSCQYLYFSDRSIKEICTELGFDDQFYFSRLFRHITGVSPSAYKKAHKK
ncbi:AraC family transcriptional regulator [Mucilaginibacter terrigena]|uniref:AraC family transcriptional regulator n=1 Tax=Mucilaginibacter terrigena TaxID=2492395 RepID=A0A4Q5LM29_9SPHI|nr:AraC family transcriptional regulator [Mucilaginibacter terrigena]RYU90728.1 AraC family transcriptional regulator [Mucilaginibacter terrigena]